MHQTQRLSQMAQCAAAISVMLVGSMLVMNSHGVADDVADDPQKRRRRIDVELAGFTVDGQCNHALSLFDLAQAGRAFRDWSRTFYTHEPTSPLQPPLTHAILR